MTAEQLLAEFPAVTPRAKFGPMPGVAMTGGNYDAEHDPYEESDRDFLEENAAAAIWLLEHAAELKEVLIRERQTCPPTAALPR